MPSPDPILRYFRSRPIPESSPVRRFKERKIVQWAFAYLAGAWVLLEVADVLLERWNLPGVLFQGLSIILAAGFFLTLILAWYHGEKGRQRVSGPELLIVASVLAVAGVFLSRLEHPAVPEGPVPPRNLRGRPVVAVLPCANLSPNPEDEYLAAALHDEILLQLSQISSLSSIGRTSVLRYAENPPPTKEIALDLGVGFIGECSVQKHGNEVRLIFQLLDGETGEQLRAEAFDQTLSPANLLNVNSEIAERVAAEVGAELSPEEMSRLRTRPTENPEAYDLYLRANDLYRVGRSVGHAARGRLWTRAISLYQDAVDLDPEFALAFARMAYAYLSTYWWALDGENAVALAGTAIDQALALNPELGEGHLALAYYRYWGQGDFASALLAFDETRRSLSGDVRVLLGAGYVLRRMGRYEEALRYQTQAFDLDPKDPTIAVGIGYTLVSLRRNAEAIEWYARARTISPADPESYGRAATTYLRLGDIENARAVLAETPDSSDWSSVLAGFAVGAYSRDYHAAATWLEKVEGPLIETPYGPRPAALFSAHLMRWEGDEAGAKAAYRTAANILIDLERPATGPVLGMSLTDLEVAYGGAGERDLALARMDSAMATRKEAGDPYGNPVPSEDVAFLHVLLGDVDGAIAVLTQLVGMDYFEAITPAVLRLDPRWDPLRGDPRYQTLYDLLEENREKEETAGG